MSATKLDDATIAKRLEALPHWTRDGDAIVRKISADSFREAQALVNRVCDLAEGMGHHPDLQWVYVNLTFRLNTHDAGGLTKLDFALATAIDAIA